jgi:hypothetical protein
VIFTGALLFREKRISFYDGQPSTKGVSMHYRTTLGLEVRVLENSGTISTASKTYQDVVHVLDQVGSEMYMCQDTLDEYFTSLKINPDSSFAREEISGQIFHYLVADKLRPYGLYIQWMNIIERGPDGRDLMTVCIGH